MKNEVETYDHEIDSMSDDKSSSEKFIIESEPVKKPLVIKILRS